MRYSHYNIFSNKLLNGCYGLCNSMTGALELISADLYEDIKSLGEEEFNPIQHGLSNEIINGFIDRGILTQSSIEEEIDELRAIATLYDILNDSISIAIIPNMDCNYRCTYCFELDSTYFKTTDKKKKMSLKDAEFIVRVINANNMSKEIILFGGEPLAKENFDIIQFFVDKLGKTHDFSAVTNGHDLQEYLTLLGKPGISHLQITIDGPQNIHDKRRISLDGISSYKRIFENISLVLSVPDVSIDIRINVDNRNIDTLDILLDDISKLSLIDSSKISVYASKVTGLSEKLLDNKSIDDKLVALHRKFSFFIPNIDEYRIKEMLINALNTMAALKRGNTGCGATGNTIAFAADGNIYKCLDDVGYPEKAYGSFCSGKEIFFKPSQKELFEAGKLQNRTACLRCRYALFCRGGCYKQALETDNCVSSKHCEIYQQCFSRILTEVIDAFIQ